MSHDGIQIRELRTLEEMKAVETMQRDVWGEADLDVLPSPFLKLVTDTGGMLLGAYDGIALVGFVFGILARDADGLTIHSDMLAVSPSYRDRRLGYRMKLAQREWCLSRGIQRVSWTFDPLQARNARLNFGKLGAVCDQYKVDYYGETTSVLHQLGTDRFWLRWELASRHVKQRIAGTITILPGHYQAAQALIRCDEKQTPIEQKFMLTPSIFIEIPGDISALQEADRALAVQWRTVTRQAFTDTFASGYQVINFYPAERGVQRVGVYELQRKAMTNGK